MANLKKLLAGAMALCMAGSVLTACGKSTEEGGSADVPQVLTKGDTPDPAGQNIDDALLPLGRGSCLWPG